MDSARYVGVDYITANASKTRLSKTKYFHKTSRYKRQLIRSLECASPVSKE